MPATNSAVFVVITNTPFSEWSHRIEERRQLIGRGLEAEIKSPSSYKTVSRRHAEVWSDHHGQWIHDVGSRLGTRVNGVSIVGMSQASMVVGDRIRLGQLQLEVVEHVSQPSAMGNGEPNGQSLKLTQTMELSEGDSPHSDQLTPAEREVVLWICRGSVDDEAIGEKLHRSPHTVRTQVASIFQKLGVHSRGEILNYVRQREEHRDLLHSHPQDRDGRSVEDTDRFRKFTPRHEP